MCYRELELPDVQLEVVQTHVCTSMCTAPAAGPAVHGTRGLQLHQRLGWELEASGARRPSQCAHAHFAVPSQCTSCAPCTAVQPAAFKSPCKRPVTGTLPGEWDTACTGLDNVALLALNQLALLSRHALHSVASIDHPCARFRSVGTGSPTGTS